MTVACSRGCSAQPRWPAKQPNDTWAIDFAFIQPNKPIQNAHIESFNGRFRDECLDQHYFRSPADARCRIERWRRTYSEERPHEACYPSTPSEHARTFLPSPPLRQSA